MSESDQLGKDLRALTSAIRDLTLATQELQRDRVEEAASSGGQEKALHLAEDGGWELIQDGTAIPGSPSDFLQRPVVVEFEEGPPETPTFCLQLAKRHLSSSKASSVDRAREAFKAGFWVRAFWTCKTDYTSQYTPLVPGSAHWVLRKGASFEFLRVTSQADSDRLCRTYPDLVFVEKFPSLTELHIFCAGASTPVPPLWKWSGQA